MDIGRNDPCHCGSGKKYKKCHLEADEAKDRKLREKAALNVENVSGSAPKNAGRGEKGESRKGGWMSKVASKVEVFRQRKFSSAGRKSG